MGLDTLHIACVVGVGGDDTMLDCLGNDPIQITAVADAAQDAVEAQSGLDVGTGPMIDPHPDFGGNTIDSILVQR